MPDHDTAPAPHADGLSAPPPEPDDPEVDIAALSPWHFRPGQRRFLQVLTVAGLDEGPFVGRWLAMDVFDPPTEALEGQLVMCLTPVANGLKAPRINISAAIGHQGRWKPVGTWHGLYERWPMVVRPMFYTLTHLPTAPATGHVPPEPPDPTRAPTRDT